MPVIRTGQTYHATAQQLKDGTDADGAQYKTQLRDRAIVEALGASGVFNFRADAEPYAEDLKFIISDAATWGANTSGKWQREDVLNVVGNVAVTHGLIPDNSTEEVDFMVSGVLLGNEYAIARTAYSIGDIDVEVIDVKEDGVLRVRISNNTGAVLPAGSINVNVFLIGDSGVVG